MQLALTIQFHFSELPKDGLDAFIADVGRRFGATVSAPASSAAHPVAPEPTPASSDAAMDAALKDATPNVRGFLRLLAKNAPNALTAFEVAERLKLPEPRSVAGLRSVSTRSQQRLMKRGELSGPVHLYEEHWDGAKMSYSMTERQAQTVLESFKRIGG
jgi:hypothetical protein